MESKKNQYGKLKNSNFTKKTYPQTQHGISKNPTRTGPPKKSLKLHPWPQKATSPTPS
jgi:hypothetical protein